MGGWDPVVIEETWTIYHCIDAIRSLTLKAFMMSNLVGSIKLPKGKR